jgi:glycosyltransferase involved in cell wall biosynthesis
MRIAFVSTILDYPFGGADTLWSHAAKAAGARGDTLLVAVSESVAKSEAVASLKAQVEIRRHSVVPRRIQDRVAGKIRRMLGPKDPLMSAIARFRPDLIIFSLGGTYDLALKPGWSEWLAKASIPFRLIANCQDEKPVISADGIERARDVFSRCERAYFVSTRNLEVTRRQLDRDLAKAAVIQNPLRWRANDVAPWPDEATVSMAAVARLEPVKGVDRLIRAAADVMKATPGWRLRVYGRGPDEAALRALAAELGVGSQVEFPGYVGSLRDIWSRDQMLVSSAVEDGVPMTIPEAMLCARPVLATAVGGARDWITDNVSGFICPSPSVADLGASLERAWAARARWRQMGAEASTQAASRYNPVDYLRLIEPVA